ncbi:unnamed protein product (macronuclear) [Paramecium tetraurelia]|uniref:CBS domain-containing protein n=1 Tax=Paramecium tetraurelia TaxID=5888 RepID=A0BCY0_PARTE|nr:uncharacterized protein GSPATT00004491001 [Paramecium tetraurelia]CAK56397.1 unnamed protein product [Paramecium tetraurelia]|eukprot:XP_001423795.1 hypothetical protein (macronuclear) [Paramecium tetraurelia strain d4-2]
MNQLQISTQEISKYKDTITQFLKDNTLYDCLAHHNQLIVLDQTFTCWEVFQIFVEENLEETLFWSSDISNYDGVFTHSDLIKVLLKLYENAFNNKSSLQQSGPLFNVIEEESEDQEESTQKSQSQKQQPRELNDDQKLRLIYEMKTISIRQWNRILKDDLESQIGFVQGRNDERLYDACVKIVKSGTSRLFVVDPETLMFQGVIHQKDILSFLIKGFTQYLGTILKQQNNILSQHQVSIKVFFSNYNRQKEIVTCKENETVYQVFYTMMHNHKSYIIPIVNNNEEYVGQINRRDIILIIKNGLFELFSQTASQLLVFLQTEKARIPAYQYYSKQFFSMDQTIKEVVENLVLSDSSALICLSSNRQIQAIITISDILRFILKDVY